MNDRAGFVFFSGQEETAAARFAGHFHEVDFHLRAVDDGLRHFGDGFGAVKLHRIVLVLQGAQRVEQVFAQILNLTGFAFVLGH